MASSKEDGTEAAAQQLGSMMLGESVETKDNTCNTENNEEAAEENEAPTKLCSACGEKSDALKKCTACKCVWYCDKNCQNRHWKEHKKECKTIKKELDKRGGKLDIGTEEDIGPLEKVPPREECPICMRALPLHEGLHMYFSCCGKTVCGGCEYQHQMQSKKRAAEKGQTSVLPTCAFCRTALPDSDEEILARTRKRAELKDPNALCNLAIKYGSGRNGLSVDQAKCIDLLRESAGLGNPDAQCQLGTYYQTGAMGLEQNEEEARKFFKEAAEGGDVVARHNVGCAANKNGDPVAAMRHWRLVASGGMRHSMNALIEYFEDGLLQHGDLAESLQAFYRSRGELKSGDRDQYIKYLKKNGKYRAEYE